jgi:hypothetical protein
MAKRVKKKILNYTVIFEPAEEGGVCSRTSFTRLSHSGRNTG